MADFYSESDCNFATSGLFSVPGVRFLVAIVTTAALLPASASRTEEIDFDREIAPLLAAHCLDCHSAQEKKGGLDLSQAKAAFAGGDSGKAIVPGDVTSLLMARVEAEEMPPKKPLPKKQRDLLKRWIANGAQWGKDPIDPFQFSSSARAGYDWWSLQPIRRPSLPEVANPQLDGNAVDAFVRAKLQEKGLESSPPADKRTLIRRLAFDLLGLPPTPEEIERFLADESPQAYGKLVERYLDSPHYGERWARHWLDVAHFSESDGFEYDRMRPHAWRYRDWVIRALNADLPYDEFARLQIAGDVIRPNDPDAIVATGFLVCGAFDGLMPKSEVMRGVMRQDELEDVVSIVSQTFLGLTVNCARCHDHKFDPVSQVDYFRILSALSGVRRGDRLLPPRESTAEWEQLLVACKKRLGELEAAARKTVLDKRARDHRNRPEPPQPIAAWDFDDGPQDRIGGLHAKLQGGAKLEGGRLVLDGKQAFAETAPLVRDLKEKTLEAWVQLANLEQRGGGVMTVQALDGGLFDSVVFGERDPRRWLAGSNFFARTKPFADAPEEAQAATQLTHVAIVYHADGRIIGYRNGQPYGQEYVVEKQAEFPAGKAQVLFGMRHGPPGGNKMLAGGIDRAQLYDRALTAEEVALSSGAQPNFVTQAELVAALSVQERRERERLQMQIAELEERLRGLREVKTFAITPQQPEPTQLLIRGNPQQKGKTLAPGGLPAIVGLSPEFGLAADAPEAERRKRLAEWMTSEKNPLFARTIVNRIWHYHFGRGLIETPNDLGFSGGLPTHPELLDWLAAELIARQWRIKDLHRVLVLSATYRQDSKPRPEAQAIDADNRLWWRYPPRRLEAEAVRDATLAVAGQLNLQLGGPSFMDFRPYVYKTTQYYEPQDPVGAEFNRRSIYRMWARGGANPLLSTFDCPDPSTTTPKRGSTTTPLQALSLFNNSFVLRMAEAFAERVKNEVRESSEKQIERAFLLAVGKSPAPQQMAVASDFVQRHGLAAFCRVLLNTNAFLYVD
jgi:hypothetical protein